MQHVSDFLLTQTVKIHYCASVSLAHRHRQLYKIIENIGSMSSEQWTLLISHTGKNSTLQRSQQTLIDEKGNRFHF